MGNTLIGARINSVEVYYQPRAPCIPMSCHAEDKTDLKCTVYFGLSKKYFVFCRQIVNGSITCQNYDVYREVVLTI